MTLNKQVISKGITHLTFIKILKTFTSKEMNDFEKFLNSPFHNNHSTLIKIFRELKKFYPQFEDTILTKEYLFNIVNKGKKFDDKLTRKYFSRLYKLAEEYLNILQVNSERGNREINVLLQLSYRDAADIYKKKLNETEKFFNKDHRIDVDNFLLKFKLGTVKYNNILQVSNKTSFHNEIADLYDNLVNFFIFNSSSVLNQLVTDKFSFKKSEIIHPVRIFFGLFNIDKYINNISKVIDSDNHDRLIFLELISSDLKLITAKSGIKEYRKLSSLIYKNKEKLSNSMLYYFLQRLNVFCMLENAKGKIDMSKEMFENYKILIEDNLFFLEGSRSLKLFDFRAILFSALKNKEYEWAEKFIYDNFNLVKGDSRKNIFHYSNSYISFYKKNYADSLEHISKLKNEFHPITVDIYILKAKIFFLLGHFDSALSLADSFRHFINGNKILADYHKETLMNFLKYFKAVVKLSLGSNKGKIKNFLSELESALHTRERKWMLEIAHELLIKN